MKQSNSLPKPLRSAWFLPIAAFLISQPLSGATFHVSPKGADSNPGTAEKPLASITAARDKARAAGGSGHIILLAPGRYFHQGTVTFDERDSGLTIRGEKPGATAELYGGQPVTGWKRWKGNIWRAPVPKETRFFNLIADGRSLTMAQTPNAGSGFGAGVKPVGPAETWKPREHVSVPLEWRNYDYEDAQLYAFHDSNWFSEMHDIIQPPDADGLTLVTKGNIGTRLFIRGVLEFLDEPGEWCLKNKEGFVYYWPKSGTPGQQVIIRPIGEKFLHLQGSSPEKPLKNVTIENVSIIGSDFSEVWTPGENNTSPNPEGMVFGENIDNLMIRKCRLLAAGHSAIMLNHHAQNCKIGNNLIMEAGFVGVYMNGWPIFGGPFKTAEESYVNKGHRVESNFIYDCGKFVGAGCGIQFYQSGDNIITRNEIGQMPRYGISYKGLCYVTFGRGEAYGKKISWDNHWEFIHTNNNRISANEIYSVCRNSHDFGAIESWGVGRGNLWDNNAIHDVDATLEWDGYGNILYADDHNHYLTIRNNILYHCNGGAVSTAFAMKSVGQVTENNLVADSDLGIICGLGHFREPTWGSVVRHNVFAIRPKTRVHNVNEGNFKGATGGVIPALPPGEKGIVEINRNAITPMDPANPNPAPYPEYGMDLDSFFGDPKLKRAKPVWDVQYADYSLASDSQAYKLGYRKIPTDIIGLRKDFPFDKVTATRRMATDKIQAEDYQRMMGLRTEGGLGIHHFSKGSWAKYSNIDFGDGKADSAIFGISSQAKEGVLLELRLDSPEGKVIGKLEAGQTTCALAGVSGVHNIFLVFPDNVVKHVDWFQMLLPPDAANSTVEAGPAAVANDGVSTATVTVTLRDKRGNLVPNKSVALRSDRGDKDEISQPSGPTDSRGTATFSVRSKAPGKAEFKAAETTGRLVIDESAEVTFSADATSSANSTVAVSPRSLRADGKTPAAITVTLKDGTGKPVAGKSVKLEKTKGEGTPEITTVAGTTSAEGVATFKVTSTTDNTFEFAALNTTDGMTLSRTATVSFTPMADAQPTLSKRGDGYTVATFTSGKGTWTVPNGVKSLEVLVVGGGGGAGKQSGGAGAGGLFHTRKFAVTPSEPITVIVGEGGAGGEGAGKSGGNSVFGPIIAYGGAGTAGYHSITTQGPDNTFSVGGEQGGHFDGTRFHPGNPGGGTKAFNGAYSSGAGAGAAGTHGNTAVGGIGLQNDITGTATYYAAGGSALETTEGAQGGAGKRTGGTHGSATYDPVVENTGAGGQGGWGVPGNKGASGIVIIAYPTVK